MKLLYPEEHLSCFNFNKNEDEATAQLIYLNKGETFNKNPQYNEIVFVINGHLSFSYAEHVNITTSKNQIFILPASRNHKISVKEDTTLFVLRIINIDLNFCDHFPFKMLFPEDEKKAQKDENVLLKSNGIVLHYIKGMLAYWDMGVHCSYFWELKLKEFFYILRVSYTKESLRGFFSSIIHDDISFMISTIEECKKFPTVNELAKKMNYSLSGFEKRFKKIFGMPCSDWLQTQKAKLIYHEINCSDKTFSEIGYEFGFSSPSNFSNFCKKHFNASPGKIRKDLLGTKNNKKQKP